jgi:GTP-binding protein Era
MHKSGFVNIIGLPNVGKSSLINYLMGEKLSIVTSKSQTTRQNMKGFINEDDYQIILVDTPGFIDEPAYQLQLTMNSYVELALEESDVLILVVDKYSKLEESHPLMIQIKKFEHPLILIINKVDQCSPEEVKSMETYYTSILQLEKIIAISTELKFGKQEVMNAILEYLPEHAAFYDKEELTDRNMRYIASEIIRESVFNEYQKEIPYSSEIVVTKYLERGDNILLEATIYVERDSQKSIIIGHNAEKLKKISMESRSAIEAFTNTKVHLFIFVKVLENWRNRENILKQFGYEITKKK